MSEYERQKQRNRAADPDVTHAIDLTRERFGGKVMDFRIYEERDDWDSATSPVTDTK